METQRHTPGPWVADHTGDYADDPAKVVKICYPDGQQRHLAKVYDCYLPGDGDGDANARLIAAAPDLLAALEDLVGLAAAAMHDANRDGGEYDDGVELAAARAAIAKARGE